MWALSIHHAIINSLTALALYCNIKRSTFSSKAPSSKFSGYGPVTMSILVDFKTLGFATGF